MKHSILKWSILLVFSFFIINGSLVTLTVHTKSLSLQDKEKILANQSNLGQTTNLEPKVIQSTTFASSSLEYDMPTVHSEFLIKEDPQLVVFGMDEENSNLVGYIFDNHEEQVLSSPTVRNTDFFSSVSLCTGDFTGDQRIEFVYGGSYLNGMDVDAKFEMFSYQSDSIDKIDTSVIGDCINPAIAGADLDGDDKEELILAYEFGGNCYLKVLTYQEDILFPSFYPEFDTTVLEGGCEPEICIGDFNGDSIKDVAILVNDLEHNKIHVKIWVYRYSWNTYFDAYWTFTSPDNEVFKHLKIAAGDCDGDLIDELAIGASSGVLGDIYCNVLDDLTQIDDQPGSMEELSHISGWSHSANDAFSREGYIDFSFGDINKNNKQELLCLYRQEAAMSGTDYYTTEDYLQLLSFTGDHFIEICNYNLVFNQAVEFLPEYESALVAEDIDFDGDMEFSFASKYRDGDTHIFHLTPNLATGSFKFRTFHTIQGPCKYIHMVARDFEERGVKIHYKNPLTQFYQETYPQLINVIAAPPTIQDSSQINNNSYSSVGSSLSNQSDLLEIKAYTSLLFESNSWLSNETYLESSSSKILTNELIPPMIQTQLVNFSESFMIYPEDHGILYSITGYHQYCYEISQHPFNSSLIGQEFVLGIPSNQTIYFSNMTDFSEKYPIFNFSQSFPQISGDLHSYLDFENLHTKNYDNFYPSIKDYKSTRHGNSNLIEEISVSDYISSDCEILSPINKDLVNNNPAILFNSSMLGLSRAYTIVYNENYTFSGSVSDFTKESDATHNAYDWQLVVYNYYDQELDISYKVLDYAVEDNSIPIDDTTDSETNTIETTSSDTSNVPFFNRIPGIPLAILIGCIFVSSALIVSFSHRKCS